MSSISSIGSSSPSASAGSSPSVAILASKVAAVDIESLSSPKKLSPKKLVVPLANVSINTDHDVEGTKVATAVDFSNTTMADLVLSDEGTTPWKQVNKKKKGPIDQICMSQLVLILQVPTRDVNTDCLRRFCACERSLSMGNKTRNQL